MVYTMFYAISAGMCNFVRMYVQWNLTNLDTIGTVEIVLNIKVSSFQGLAVLHLKITHEDDSHITSS